MENSNTTISSAELPSMPPELTKLDQNNSKQSVNLQDEQIPQEARDELSSLLGKDYDSIVSKSPTDVGKTIFFQMDILTTCTLTAYKP